MITQMGWQSSSSIVWVNVLWVLIPLDKWHLEGCVEEVVVSSFITKYLNSGNWFWPILVWEKCFGKQELLSLIF